MNSPANPHAMTIQVGTPCTRESREPLEFGHVRILRECSVRASLVDVESVHVALEVHHKSAGFDYKNPDNQALTSSTLIDER